ncbi:MULTISPECIES: cysteine hydrolase family protein [Psychrobacter]|uniref:Isochorismatase family protein n=1 Tax=Psychrobacter sanguinis TaxID=861445 RepID=A0A844M1N9_9GAMM|nr:cysteine hydrolase family protein [Psychrobacter sanguinis]MUG32869.1 isochorismatase family protein [Psychrobacter sanguinis]
MKPQALIVVDIQNEYFEQGKLPLVGINAAADKAALVIESARQKGHTVIHVRHEMPSADAPIFTPGTEGVAINDKVKPIDGETVIVKHYPNSFRETSLKTLLDEAGITQVTVIGAMSHMCIDATVRAAVDFGYTTTTIHDACATLDLEFKGTKVPAAQAHATIMAAIEFLYGEVIDAQTWIER